MRFVIDENLGAHIAAGLAGFGEDVVYGPTELYKGVSDEELLPWVGTNGYCLVTQDHQILKKPAERKLIREYGVGLFCLKPPGGRWNIVKFIVNKWPKIVNATKTTERPFALIIRPRTIKSAL